jgi:hypothetical protein
VNGQERDVTVTLNAYQRDNLLNALMHIAGIREGRIPARRLDNGDWVREVAGLLGWRGDATDWGNPNFVLDRVP